MKNIHYIETNYFDENTKYNCDCGKQHKFICTMYKKNKVYNLISNMINFYSSKDLKTINPKNKKSVKENVITSLRNLAKYNLI